MATIEKTGKRWRVRQFLDGKLRTVATCTTKVEAEMVQRRTEETERARGRIQRGATLPLSEIITRWQNHKVSAGNDPLHTKATVDRMRSLIVERGWDTSAGVTPASASEFRTNGGSPRAGAKLAAILKWAGDHLDQFVHPKTLVVLRPGKAGRKPSPRLLSAAKVAEVERLAGLESANAATLIHCLSIYGWRPITAARMTVADFDPEGGTITCQVKGGDVVRHLLLPETITRMRWMTTGALPTDPLFRSPITGEAWKLVSTGNISRWSCRHLKFKVYDLKRYAISTMLNHGVSPQDVAAFTGHRTIAQVLKYSRSNEVRQGRVLELLGKKRGKSVVSPELAAREDAT